MPRGLPLALLLAACTDPAPVAEPPAEPAPRITPRVVYYTLGES